MRKSFKSAAKTFVVVFGLSGGMTVAIQAAQCSAKPYQTGEASWYGPGLQGNETANGEIFNQYGISAAHKTLPLGTWVKVVNTENDRELVVRINDRGPYIDGRIIDLSRGAAEKLDYINAGTTNVQIFKCT